MLCVSLVEIGPMAFGSDELTSTLNTITMETAKSNWRPSLSLTGWTPVCTVFNILT